MTQPWRGRLAQNSVVIHYSVTQSPRFGLPVRQCVCVCVCTTGDINTVLQYPLGTLYTASSQDVSSLVCVLCVCVVGGEGTSESEAVARSFTIIHTHTHTHTNTHRYTTLLGACLCV